MAKNEPYITPPKASSFVQRWWQRVCELLNVGIYSNVTDQSVLTPFTIGTSPDYSQFEEDGTLVAHGDATCFLDEFSALIGQKLETPGSDIVQNNAEGSLTFKTSAATTDYVVMNVQFNHDWDYTDVYPHLHWWQTTANTPNWLIQYRWQVNGDTKETSWTSAAWDSNAFTYTSGTLTQITGFPDISAPEGVGVSAILQLRLIRDNANGSGLFAGADPVAASQDAVFFDVHKRVNTLGSRQLYVK